jgi:hypothetical protein
MLSKVRIAEMQSRIRVAEAALEPPFQKICEEKIIARRRGTTA